MIFIGLEISSIASYVLAGYLREDRRANESALKYFLLGSFASAFFLYGIAWLYGLTGATNLDEIRQVLGNRDLAPAPALTAAAAPFQVWTPDVYQGAPAPVSAFLSAGPKAAAFAVFLRVFGTALDPVSGRWLPLIWLVALATMVIGNFAALGQSNIKRLLAYSSIAHAGYVLVALTAHSEIGTAAAMFYLLAYAFMNVGAFAIVAHLAGRGEKMVEIEDLAGLSSRQPVTAALFAVFLLSLIGVPLTGGFFGKFYLFKAALDSNLIWLTVLGLLNSAVAAYYYLRVLVVMYFHEPAPGAGAEIPASGMKTAWWICGAATLLLGIYPGPVLDFAAASAKLLK
jgi:NADH-quinone oxidoreductase subunit N